MILGKGEVCMKVRWTLQTDLRTSENRGWTPGTVGSLLCQAVQLQFSPGGSRGETDSFKNADLTHPARPPASPDLTA